MVLEFTPVTFDPTEPDTIDSTRPADRATTTTYYSTDSGADYRWKARRDVAFGRGDWLTTGIVCIFLVATVEPNINYSIRTSSFGKFFNQVNITESAPTQNKPQQPQSTHQQPALTKFADPLPGGELTSSFFPCLADDQSDCREHPVIKKKKPHTGIDLSAGEGASVHAIADGKVTDVVSNCVVGKGDCGGGYGNFVEIQHKNGYVSLYAHLKEVTVKLDQSVKAGQEIGKEGSTGTSTASHLHFSLEKFDPATKIYKFVDPAKYFPGYGGVKAKNPPASQVQSRLQSPVANMVINSLWGYRNDPITSQRFFHNGLDFAGAHGTPILASAAGTVEFAGTKSDVFNASYGIHIIINHGNGQKTLYGHLSQSLVSPGQSVQSGQNIGKMGTTGRSTGVHLHFEVRQEGAPVDPLGLNTIDPLPLLPQSFSYHPLATPGLLGGEKP